MELRNLAPTQPAREDEELLLSRPRVELPKDRNSLSTILDSVFNFTNSIVGAGDLTLMVRVNLTQ